jgi:hypothetical protein
MMKVRLGLYDGLFAPCNQYYVNLVGLYISGTLDTCLERSKIWRADGIATPDCL